MRLSMKESGGKPPHSKAPASEVGRCKGKRKTPV
jgi:hypothetical protein